MRDKTFFSDAAILTALKRPAGFLRKHVPLTSGGVALLRCQKSLEAVKAEGDLQIVVNIVRKALEETMRQIYSNAGWEGSIVVEKVKERRPQDLTSSGDCIN